MKSDDKSKQYAIQNKRLDHVYATIGKRLNAARKKQGLSQEQLAVIADIDRSHVGFIEQGRRKPTLVTLHKLVKPLKISLEDLFRGL